MKESLEPYSDLDLINSLAGGSESAFDLLYHKTSYALYGKIIHIVKDTDSAKEILQNVFLKIWENRKRIDPSRSFKAYLFKIVENEIYNHFRKAAKDRSLVDRLAKNAVEYSAYTEEELIREERFRLLEAAFEKLPPVRRQVYQLAKIEGKSYGEIADILQISTSTVSDHIVKANRFLKHYLAQQADMLAVVILVILGY